MNDYKKDIILVAVNVLEDVPMSEFENQDVELSSLPSYDSMSVVAFVTALEERFGISFYDDELIEENFRTIGTVFEIIGKKLGHV